jgi:hypothetical protein
MVMVCIQVLCGLARREEIATNAMRPESAIPSEQISIAE